MEDKLKVIFIEDDPNLGLIIVLALQSKGYEVYYANTLSGIQDMIEKDYPNILLLDLEVGNQNALDYLPFIRSVHKKNARKLMTIGKQPMIMVC